VHEFVVHFHGNIKELVHAAIREFQLERPATIRLFMESDFGDAFRGNGDPIHVLRAPFRLWRAFQQPALGKYFWAFGDVPFERYRPVAAFISSSVFGLFSLRCDIWIVARVSCSNSRILIQPFLHTYQILQSF
jgi:hypothetical protein